MKRKSLYTRFINRLIKTANNIKHIGVKWCYDEQKCINKSKDCNNCDYYTNWGL